MKYFAYGIIGVVAASVIAGFFIVGSPGTERLRRFDEQRIQHLQIIQSEILNYWINKERLPSVLSELQDSIRGFVVPKDPESGADYEYIVRGPEEFTLCAVFALENQPNARVLSPEPYASEQNWQHGIGKFCFDRKIDKELYGETPIKPSRF
ncbi:MAG: hypothetical protein HYT03_02555 [Candidatus Harrisonbacteria bacterium]|nr:hypothetical protein [Candidatus Harrisonbacteria bacterium]